MTAFLPLSAVGFAIGSAVRQTRRRAATGWRTARHLAAAALIALGAGAAPAKADDIVDIAVGDGRFTTLVAALQAADLVETLKGPGPFTVFAPIDDAFAALPAGTVEGLLEPESKGQLTSILLYHVDDRFLPSSFLPHRTIPIRPINDGSKLCVTRNAEGVTIGDSTGELANVIIADIRADNGVIHVIDKVLLPTATRCNH